jgi:hypothetical protein
MAAWNSCRGEENSGGEKVKQESAAQRSRRSKAALHGAYPPRHAQHAMNEARAPKHAQHGCTNYAQAGSRGSGRRDLHLAIQRQPVMVGPEPAQRPEEPSQLRRLEVAHAGEGRQRQLLQRSLRVMGSKGRLFL